MQLFFILMDDIKILEKLNGRAAMMLFVALIGAYLSTGQIVPGMAWKTMNTSFIANSAGKAAVSSLIAFLGTIWLIELIRPTFIVWVSFHTLRDCC